MSSEALDGCHYYILRTKNEKLIRWYLSYYPKVDPFTQNSIDDIDILDIVYEYDKNNTFYLGNLHK